MGLAEAVLTRAAAPAESRAMQVTPWGDWNSGGGVASSGVHVNEDSALQLLVVNGCVTLIANTISTLPRDIFRAQGDGTKTEVPVKPRWFEQPNPSTDILEFLTQTLTSLLLDGNAYWPYGVDLNFAPTEIHCLNPRLVEVKAAQSGSGVEYWVNGQLFRGRLLHIKGVTRPGALKGMSPVENARQSIGLGLGAQEFAGSFYRNGSTLSGVIESPTDLTKDQARTLKDNWSRDHSGLGNAHLPGVLVNGATWKPMSVTPEQAQFLQTREYQAGEICAQLFLLDPSMLGIAINRGQNLCADTETEILTVDGWRTYDEIKVGDTCLTLNADTGLAEWQPIEGVYISEHGYHEMRVMKNGTHSSVTTPDHRWPVYRIGQTEMTWRQSQTMSTADAILAAAPVANLPTEQKYSDAFVELIAWFYTEGWVGKYGEIRIAQSHTVNPDQCDRIRAAITEMYGPEETERYIQSRPTWHEDIGPHCTHFRLNKRAAAPLLAVAPEKVPSAEFLTQLTRAQLELFVQTSLNADGSITSKGTWVLGQKDLRRLEAFQFACVLAGKSGAIHQNASGMWSMCVQRNNRRQPKGQQHYFSDVVIEGKVWCPTTPNHTWFARRDGTTYFTGNTYANLEQRGIHLVQFTLLPWIIRLERAFSFLLPKPQYMKFNVDGLQRADLKTRYEAHRIALGPTQPFEAVNEARALEDLEPMAGFDVIKAPPEPAPPPPAPPEPVTIHMSPILPAPVIQMPEVRAPDVHVTNTVPDVHVPETVINIAPAVNNVIVPEQRQPDVFVEVKPSDPTPIEVTVEATEVRNEISVQSAVPDVHVAAPDPTPITVNVEQAENRIDVHPTPVEVNVAAADPTPIEVRVEAATIEVNPTPIEIHPTEVNVAAPEVVFHAPEVNVNVAPPENRIEVNVEPTPVEVRAPDVFVTTPDITVEAAQITVNQPEIRNDIHVDPTPIEYHAPDVYVDQPNINVESPTVHVRPPALRIGAPVINMPKQGTIRRTFERDDKGITIAIIEEPIEEADAASGSEQGPPDESH